MEGLPDDIFDVAQAVLAKPKGGSCPADWTWIKLHVGTNTIYKVAQTSSGKQFILRVYNQCSGVDHDPELAIIETLAKSGRHPKVLFSCADYRLEEFVDSQSLDIFQLHALPMLLQVVELISTLHNDTSLLKATMPLLTDKRPFILQVYESWLGDFKRAYQKIEDRVRGSKYAPLIQELRCLFGEDFQKTFSSLLPKGGELVLSHNDISPANLLLAKTNEVGEKGRMQLIDYEYCGLNYRGYDLAVLIEDIVTDYQHPHYPTFKMHTELRLTPEEEDAVVWHYVGCSGLKSSDSDAETYFKRLRGEVTACKIVFQLAGVLWGVSTHDWDAGFDENDCWRIEYARQRWDNFRSHMHSQFGWS